jgi:hypothetical protein
MSTDSFDKIRLKGGPKQYKTGRPGACGRARLQQRLHKLTLDLRRFARRAPSVDEATWATQHADVLSGLEG